MMGVAGEGVKADYVDSLDLFHTMEAYFTWYPNGAAGVSKYLLNKFLYTVDRDPELVERYREDPRGTVAWWEAEMANAILNCTGAERSTWLAFTDDEREALRDARPRHALRAGRAPVPDAHPVHRACSSATTTSRWASSANSLPVSVTGRSRIRISRPSR